MQKNIKKYLLLEQLEERIFLDANPIAAVEPIDPAAEPTVELIPISPPQGEPQDAVTSQPEPTAENSEQETAVELDEAEDTSSDTAATVQEEGGDTVHSASSENSGESTISLSDGIVDVEQTTLAESGIYTQAVEVEIAEKSSSPEQNTSEASDAIGLDDATEITPVEAIDPMIGEDFTFTVSLDNTTGTTLYGPYIDLYMPTTGDDGDDGVSFVDATYLDTPVNATVQTFDALGEITHPYAIDVGTGNLLIISGGTPGDSYITLEMPFGSFTPDQPAAQIEVTAHIDEYRQVDDAGGSAEDFDIQVYTGYRYGSDSLDNPSSNPPVDPTLVETQTFRPEVIRFEKQYLGPEHELATGPNYPEQYQITIDIATGQTISNLQLTENLPDEIFYLGNDTVRVNGVTTGFSVTSPNLSGNGEGIFTNGLLTVTLDSPVTGGTLVGGEPRTDDVVITFDYYVPRYYADGTTPILDPLTGDDAIGGAEDRQVINDVQVEGDWSPEDPDDDDVHIVMDAEVNADGIISPTPGIDELFNAEAITIQKDVGLAPGGDTGIIDGYNPGDYVQYTLNFQISDYFNFGNIEINDVLPDGLELQTDNTNGTYTPTFSIQDETGSWSGNWTIGTNLTTATQSDDDTEITFDVSAVAGGADGILQGDLYDDSILNNPATGTITYYARIKDEYLSTGVGDSSGPGDVSVDQGDLFNNSVDIEGQIYGDDGAGGLTATSFDLDQDDSSASFQIEVGGVTKQIYAINGNTDLSIFTDPQGRLHMQPGDTVTYRLQYQMPTSEFESFRLDDYLPLPAHDAGEITITTVNTTESSIPPAAGLAYLHPDDTFSETFTSEVITIETNTTGGENRISFVYDEHDNAIAQETFIDILFTVTVTDEPFADGLYLTNQVRAIENGTPGISSASDGIIQIVLDEPVLEITKGIVESDNDADIYSANANVHTYFTEPGSSTGINSSRLEQSISSDWLDSNDINTNVADLDAGDTVTVALIIENSGNADAFDVTLTDALPLGYAYVASSLQATDGNAISLSYSGADSDLFGGGITIDDTADQGSIDGYDPTSGTNIIVITYDLVFDDSVGPDQALLNTATLTGYAGDNGAANHIPSGITDEATAQIADVVIDKDIDSTSQSHTTGSSVAIGETITYTVAFTLPEGTSNDVTFSDLLDPSSGLEILSLDSLSASSALLVSVSDLGVDSPINDAFLSSNSTIAGDGLSFSIDFEDVENRNRDNDIPETITLTYTALVRNIGANQNNDTLANNASWTWTDGNGTGHSVNDSETVTVVEPNLRVRKLVDNPNPDEGDTVTFTIDLFHRGISSADAFDTILSDTLPSGYDNVTITSQSGTGSLASVTNAVSISGNTLSGSWDEFLLGDTYNITVTADLVDDPQAGQNLTNTATIDWTSLPEDGDPNERTGTPVTNDPDDYITSSSAVVTVTGTIDKIAPSPSSYTIGDEVQYYILVTLPEGDTNNLIVTDDLPTGMQYVAGSQELFTTQAGDPSGLLSQDFSGTVSLISVSGGGSDGAPVSFSYGDISITFDNDPAGENDAFVVGLRALVTDIPGNRDDSDGAGPLVATLLTNDTYMNYDNPSGGTTRINDPSDPTVSVIEPWIITDKSVDQTTGVEAGDTLTYTVSLTNGGNDTAYEVNFNDTLAPGTSFAAIQSAAINGTPVANGTAVAAGSAVTFSDATWDLAPTQVLTLTYTVIVESDALVDGTHTNSIDADWSSQDGTDPDERIYDEDDGVDSPVDGGANADRDSDDAVFSMDPVTITKSDGGLTQATIGDTITYTLTINSPQGTIDNFVVEDVLTQGLIFNNDATITTAGFSFENTSVPIFAPTNDGSTDVTITWNLGDTVVSTDDPLIITYTALVADVGTNYYNENLSNSASIEYDNAQGGHETPAPVTDGLTVSEPWIITDKTVDQTTGVEAGDTLTYTVSLTNGGNDTAYEVNFNDTLAPGTSFASIQSAAINGTPVVNGTAVAAGSAVTFSDDTWDLAPTQVLTLTYTVIVESDALVDGTHTNSVDADWSSQDGTDPDERIYDEDDGVDSPVDGGANADRDSDDAVFSMDPVTIAKSDGGVTQATIGDTITYTLTINSPQGTIDSFVVEDVLAEGLIFNNDATITSAGFTYENTTIPTYTPLSNNGSTDVTITWDLGDTVVSTDDPLIITYTALVADVGRNFLGEGLGNTASIEYDNAQGVPQTPAPVTDGLTVTEPQITTSKSVADSPDAGTDATPGEILTYTARFTNTGNADAFEVNGIDTLAAGTEFIALSSAFNNSGTDLTGSTVMSDNGDGTISIVGDWDIAVNDWVEIQYTVTVLSAGFTSGNYTNTVDADWTNQDGPVGTERIYNDTGTSPVDADQDTDDAVFTVSPTASLGDTLFFDANGDGGPFDSAAGDVGISGVNITISADVDGDGILEFSQSTLTNATGLYIFTNLAAFDDYNLTVDYDGTNGSVFNLDAAGYTQTFDLDENALPTLDHTASSISLTPGQNRLDVDFGYTGQNTVGDTVWYDLDADGVQDPGENGIDGLTVTLIGDIDGDGIDEYTASTTTASDGTYFFSNLPAGSYDVTVSPPTASTPTYDYDTGTGSPDNTSPVVLGADEDNLNIDFGLHGTGSIGDYIWYDADGDGNQDEVAAAGIANVTVSISGDIDGDGIVEYTDSTVTASDGSYQFSNLLGGNYAITVDDSTLPAGMEQTGDPDATLDNSSTVILAPGEINTVQDFGYTGLNSAGDTVWFDFNNNGTQDAGEDGIGNVNVTLTADIDGDGIIEYSSTTTTNGDGLYTFTNLPSGNYTIAVDPTSLPPGAVQTYDLDDGFGASNNLAIFTMDGASDRDNVDFGYRGTGSLGDFVWYDANFDGGQNDGPLSGLESVTVLLSGDIDGDATIDYTTTTTTSADGSYSFDNLLGGSYSISINTATLPGGSANWRQTFDLDDTTGPFTTADNAAATELGINGAALNRTDVDFGYTGNSSIGDTIFFDADNSGSQTGGDTGITDVLVTLTADIDGDGTPDFSWTDITDASGLYLFDNLPAFDSYTVTVDPANLPPGTVPTYDLDGIDSENSVSGIMLGVAENRNDVDFGYFSSGTGSIGDTVWYDGDADGVLDAGEQGLAGVNLILTGDITGDGLNDISFATTTDENGLYQFNNLLPGDYTVTVNPVPAGMEQTFDIDGLGTANAASLSLADGENNNNVDFGYTGSGSIGDTIYFDADNSASETAGDGYIPGVTVTLAGDVNNDGIEDVLTTTTDTNGNYLFANLPDGDYTITVDPTTLPAGMSQTGDPDGVNDDSSAITLAGGADVMDQDFGYIGSGSIGDTIWEDDDGDGTQNGAEGGLSGVDVSISVDFDGDGTPGYTETTTTDGNGNYSFDNLPAGEYTISVETDTLPPTYILTGDPDSNPDSTSTVNLPAGGTNLDQDFGYQDTGLTTGSIGDTIYFDTDGSGAQMGGEPGISGVTVSLSGDIDGDGASENVNTTTDLNGNYLFDNLPAGDYTITVNPATLPAGMIQTADPDGGNDNSAFVALAAGEDNTLQDFGYNGTGSLGDTIFFDANNNGIQESNEGGIDNVQVELNLDLNGDGIADYTETITTDADGNYLFEELPAGEYTITVDTATLPSGMIQSSDPDGSLNDMTSYNLSGGENNLNQDFGYTGTGAIGDTIWNDADGDGAQDAGETGLSGVAVSIEADIDGDGIADYTETIVTDSSGNYLFGNLPAGNYTITVDTATLPIGYSQSGDPDGTNDNATTLILVADENNLDQDFGYNSGTGSIGDTIFFDVNGNGAQDGSESGLPGVTVSLTGDVDGDGIPDTITTATDSSGAYLFDGLPAGDYTITVDPATLPDGMNQTADPNGGNDNTSNVLLAADEDNQDQDFGYQGTGSIGDTIWNDSNGDGILNGSEGALPGPGIDITLTIDFDGNGTVDYTQTTTTNGSGNYLFDNLPAGDYTISVDTADIPGGYVLTADPDGNPDSTTGLTLAAGEDNLNQDFGYTNSGSPTGSIGDTIYYDENNNGTQDGADVGLPGVSVTLAGDIDGDGSTDSVSTTTDANGNYLFDNLPTGDYTVSVDPATLPGGMNQTDDPDGVNDNNSTVTLPPGIDNDTQDFGYTGSSVIGDTIYFDTNGNGVQDSTENGLPGVDVSITVDFDGDGSPDYTSTTTTDGNGNYSFGNLPAGEYTVSVNPGSLPSDVRPSGDPDATLDNTTTLVLGPSETNNDQDFGYTGTGSIGDTIYYDADGNGFQSPGERGLGGVTVTLQGDFDNNGTIEAVTTTTDANGTYLFDNLTAGDYTVYVDTTTLPGGLTQTGDPDATLDNQSTVVLSAGEANLLQDFGYGGPSPFPPALPPQPIIPVVPLTPPSPLPSPSPVPIAPPDQGLVADAFFMYRQFGDKIDTEIFNSEEMLPWQPPILPVSPMYTGHTEPGTTIQLVLYDALGNQIGYESVMADTAGNWMADFPETIMYELPHRMEIVQTISSYNASSAGFFNMRTYFAPSFSSMIYAHTRLDVEAVFAYMPSTVIESVHHSNLSPFDITWNDFNGYEFVAPSTNPAQNSH